LRYQLLDLQNKNRIWLIPLGGGARSQNFEKRLLASSCLSVRLSARNNLALAGRILMKFGIWLFFRKSVKKIQISLKSNKKKGYFAWRPIYIFDHISLSSS